MKLRSAFGASICALILTLFPALSAQDLRGAEGHINLAELYRRYEAALSEDRSAAAKEAAAGGAVGAAREAGASQNSGQTTAPTDRESEEAQAEKAGAGAESAPGAEKAGSAVISFANIAADSVSAAAGERGVELSLRIRNNPGLAGMALSIRFDGGALELKDAKNGEAFSALNFTAPGAFSSRSRFVWDTQYIEARDVRDGEILSLKFDVKEGAEPGIYPISLSYRKSDALDNELSPVEIKLTNGQIEVV